MKEVTQYPMLTWSYKVIKPSCDYRQIEFNNGTASWHNISAATGGTSPDCFLMKFFNP
jgi:hypothetical protein